MHKNYRTIQSYSNETKQNPLLVQFGMNWFNIDKLFTKYQKEKNILS